MTPSDFLLFSLQLLAVCAVFGLAQGVIDLEDDDDDQDGGTLQPVYVRNR